MHRSTYLGNNVDVVYDDEQMPGGDDDDDDDWFQRNITAGK